MTFIISNGSNTDILLNLDRKTYTIKANEKYIRINSDSPHQTIWVKRQKTLPLPNYKKMLMSEILGGESALFIGSQHYTFDVSAGYSFSCDPSENVGLMVVNTISEANPEGIYNAIQIVSDEADLPKVFYRVENKDAISEMYKKCRRKGRFWYYVILETLFTLLGIGVLYPLLFALLAATNALFVKILLILVPFLIMGVIALIAILPLHLLSKCQDRSFLRAMEHKEIYSYLHR